MKKLYFVTVLFILLKINFAQTNQSLEEELMLFGAEDFFIDDSNISSNSVEPFQIQEDTVVAADDGASSLDTTTVPKSGRVSGRLQAIPAFSSSAPISTGQGKPTDASVVEISVFDTASVTFESSIDFSRNLSQYRSPQKALFYSLLIPGFGQAYNKKYWRTGLYAAIEVGMIAGAIYFRKDAKNVRKNAENFAKEHFEKDSLEKFYRKLTEYGEGIDYSYSDYEEEKEKDVGRLIFGDNLGFFNEFDSITGKETKGYERYLEEFDNDFYGNRFGVGSIFGVHGWDDAAPDYGDKYSSFYPDKYDIDSATLLRIMIEGKAVFGASRNQNDYNSRMDYSRKQMQRSSVFIVGIFVNHVASAVDAFISAIIHNRKLLKEETGDSTKPEDILSRISINGGMYVGADYNLTSTLGLTWRF
ncbi:MAG: DUF5683 domain-containing protein [Chitinispirillales bacterium]|jgi:hypothetical protein|nr:DUF5683 domain-containing protein [Chitinispirillales bacterium]